MPDIILHKINEVYIQIEAEPSVLKEINEFFKYRMPNYQFTPKGRKGWEGWIYLFNYRNNYLYSGLLKYLLDFARNHKYSVETNPDLLLSNNLSRIEAAEYIKSLNITAAYLKSDEYLQARDYQELGLAKAVRYRRLTLISPTRSGKSFILYCFVRYVLETDCKRGLLIVPTTSLVEQMYGDFQEYSAANLWSVEDRVQRLYEGYTRKVDPKTQLLISTWQSLSTMPPEFLNKFDFILGDEAHTFAAKTVGKVAAGCVNAKYRIACTGTTHEEDVNNLKVEGLFGPISKLTTTKKLMDQGHIATLAIKSLVLKHPPLTQSIIDASVQGDNAAAKFAAEINYIVNSVPRNRFIKNLAVSLDGNTLVMFHYERHGKIIHGLIKEKLNESLRKLFFVNGKTETETREEVRKITDGEKNAIIVGSTVFSTGITIRNLNNIIFAVPFKSKTRTLQSLGRSLGLGDDKTTATLYDIADDFRDTRFQPPNYTLRHYEKRLKLYAAENFNISHYTIQLRK